MWFRNPADMRVALAWNTGTGISLGSSFVFSVKDQFLELRENLRSFSSSQGAGIYQNTGTDENRDLGVAPTKLLQV